MRIRGAILVAVGVSLAAGVLFPMDSGSLAPLSAGARAPEAACKQVATRAELKVWSKKKSWGKYSCLKFSTGGSIGRQAASDPRAPLTTDPNSNVKMAAWMPPVVDQGAAPACTSFAVAYGIGGYWLKRSGQAVSASGPRAHAAVKAIRGESPEGGVAVGDAWSLVETVGIPLNVDKNMKTDWKSPLTVGEQEAAQRFKLQPHVWLKEAGDGKSAADLIPVIVGEINASRPIAVSMLLGDEIFAKIDPAADIVNAYKAPQGTNGDYLHAMVIIGYRSDAVLVQNSWGPWWAGDGRVWMSWEYLFPRLLEASVSYGLVGESLPPL